MSVTDTLIRFFQEGGMFMYPIAFLLALGLAIVIERYMSLTFARSENKTAFNRLYGLLKKNDLETATKESGSGKTAVAEVLNYGLERMQTSGSDRQDIELAMEEGLMESIPQLEKRTHYLATLANVATLLGLLGTIIGLIQAFTAVANANPADKADMLSASISVAMNTTAFGLMVAIPLLLLHAVLQTKTTAIVDSLEMASVKFLNLLTKK